MTYIKDQRRKTSRYRLYLSINRRVILKAFNKYEIYIDFRVRTCFYRDFNKLKIPYKYT